MKKQDHVVAWQNSNVNINIRNIMKQDKENLLNDQYETLNSGLSESTFDTPRKLTKQQQARKDVTEDKKIGLC